MSFAGGFVPKEDLIGKLTEMGISKNAATWALYYTGNQSVDLAAAMVFDNPDNLDLEAPFNLEAVLDESSDEDEVNIADMAEFMDPGDFFKMVFVINSDLGMGVGKIAAQVAHACLGVYKILADNPQTHGESLLAWEQFGETKIVLKGDNAIQLTDLATRAASKHLAHYVVEDAGRTQVAAGSMTVLGIMGKASLVDQITGSLPLL